jgi:two-component system sensor histidine kinase QseC
MSAATGRSLRRRLLLPLIASITLGVGAVGVGVFLSAQDEIDELFDAQLAQAARTLLELPLEPGELHDDERPAAIHPYEHKLAFVLRRRDGSIVQRSPFADLGSVPLDCAGFVTREIGDLQWRLDCFAAPARGLQVVVGQRLDIREELVRNIVVSQFLPFLLALPLVVGIAWIAVGRGLAPLEALSTDIARRSPRDLRPVEIGSVPAEVAPMVAALNRLLGLVARTLEQERGFTADAAHELRTPLAALRTQAEVARNALPAGVARQALDKVVQGVERATHLVEQLLVLARVDDSEAVAKVAVALHALAREIVTEAAEQAQARELELSLAGAAAATTRGHRAWLAILLRNLVDNAIRYTPDGGAVEVRVEDDLIEVVDNGPGIPAEERDQVTGRFYRGSPGKGAGAGLGLSIVARIAELHDATIELADGDGGRGLRVRVRFPAGGVDDRHPGA